MKTISAHQQAKLAAAIIDRIRPLLAGHPVDVQGAVLCELLAVWLAGHQGPGAPDLRDELLALHVKLVKQLIPIVELDLGLRHR